MKINIDYDTKKLSLEQMTAAVREEVLNASKTLDSQLVDRARALATGSMVGVRSGLYKESIRGEVKVSRNRITSRVYSRAPEAHLVEYGAVRGPHDILPDTKRVLSFLMNGKRVFATKVHNPGSTTSPRPVLKTALEQMSPRIVSDITAAMNRGLARS